MLKKTLGVNPFFIIVCLLLALPAWAQTERVEFKAQSIRTQQKQTVASGKVEIRYKGVTLWADQVTYQSDSGKVIADGNITMVRPEGEIKGSHLDYNLKTQTGVFLQAEGIARNLTVQDAPLQGEIRFKGQKVVWETNRLVITEGSVTSCELPQPHYRISAETITIIPKDRLIANRVKLYLHARRVYTKPSLTISLDSKRKDQSLVPRIGHSGTDGWKIQESYSYLINEHNYGNVRLDLFQKGGLGKNIEHFFSLGKKGSGAINWFDETSNANNSYRYDFSGRLQYALPRNHNLGFYYDLNRAQTSSVYLPHNITTQINLDHQGSRHSYYLAQSIYNYGSVNNRGLTAIDYLSLSPVLSSRFQAEFNGFKSDFDNISFSHLYERLLLAGKFADLQLDYEKSSGYSGYSLDREPEVILRLKPGKLMTLPYALTFSAGSFFEEGSKVQTKRGEGKLALLDRRWTLGGNRNLFTSASLHQFLYDHDQSQTLVRAKAMMNHPLSSHLNAGLHYFYQQAQGVTPLELDRYNNFNVAAAALQFYNKNYFNFEIYSGYDFIGKDFNSLVSRLQFTPAKDWRLNLGNVYDLENQKALGYEGQFNLKLSPMLNLQYWGYYDTTNQQFTYHDYKLQQDWHCWQGSLVYRSTQKELWLQIALKAFPYDDNTIGASSQIQALPQNWWGQYRR